MWISWSPHVILLILHQIYLKKYKESIHRMSYQNTSRSYTYLMVLPQL
ncbi:hypothetical protein ACHAXN_000149 [Cyclotella atomus]